MYPSGPILIGIASSLWALDALLRTGLTATIPSARIVLIEHIFGFVLFLPVFFTALPLYKRLTSRQWAAALALALVSGVGGTLLFTQALGTSFATGDFVTPVLLQKTQPIIVMILSALFLRETLTLRFLALVPLALIGSYMVSFGTDPVKLQLVGKELVVLLSLGASVAWGSGTILSKALLSALSYSHATALRFALTIPIAFAASILLGQTFAVHQLTGSHILRFVLIALTIGGVSTLIYYAGLKRTKASVATFAELLFPVVSIIIAVTPLNPYGSPQTLSLANVFGVIILLGSILLISWENAQGERGDTGTIRGSVIRGHGDGKKLGFPTANISLQRDVALPYGVYACYVRIGEMWHQGAAHWGPRLVFGETKPQMEVHLFNFSSDIYGKTLDIKIVGFIRATRNFTSLKAMTAQIRRDCQEARRMLANVKAT